MAWAYHNEEEDGRHGYTKNEEEGRRTKISSMNIWRWKIETKNRGWIKEETNNRLREEEEEEEGRDDHGEEEGRKGGGDEIKNWWR